jgi:hypothetical protein
MRRRRWMAFFALLCVAPVVSHAQDKESKQAKRKIAEVLSEFNEEMRGYERELKYFQRVAAFRPLFDLHAQLLGQAAQMRKLEMAGRGSGPVVLELAREMNRTARQLDAATATLEKRAEAVSSRQDRAVAERMKKHADTMVKTLGQLVAMFR